jgi:thiol peroxidase
MANITLHGDKFHTSGNLPAVGTKAADFSLVANDLSRKSLSDFKGSRVLLNIFPSVDTGTCATSARTFNKTAADLENTQVVCVSRDLPFAQARFCGAEGIENVSMLSDYISGGFGNEYGLNIIDGPLEGLNSRCIIVIDENGTITHTEQVPEIVDEPNYDAALNALK